MSASECVEAHARLSPYLYAKATHPLTHYPGLCVERFYSQSFELAVKSLIVDCGLGSDALFAEEDASCKV